MASDKLHHGPQGYETKPKEVNLLLYPNGTLTPTFRTAGGVASVARGATGVYNITLTEPYHKIARVQALYCTPADNEDIYAQGGTMANEGSSVAVVATVKLKTAANNVDVSADAAKFISVAIMFEDADTVIRTG